VRVCVGGGDLALKIIPPMEHLTVQIFLNFLEIIYQLCTSCKNNLLSHVGIIRHVVGNLIFEKAKSPPSPTLVPGRGVVGHNIDRCIRHYSLVPVCSNKNY